MWRGRISGYSDSDSDSYWDNIPQNLYASIFLEADNIHQIYGQKGFNYDGSSSHLEENYLQTMSDEAIARSLQDIEMGVLRMPFGFGYPFTLAGGREEGSSSSSGEFEGFGYGDDADPDNMGYEQISELGESIGNITRGLSEEQISVLPTHKYKRPSKKTSNSDDDDDSQCVICQMPYKKGDELMSLPCAHKYHEKCIQIWLAENKSCCVCKKEVAV